jgi:hypothetical protein
MNDAGELPSPCWVNTGGSDLLKRLFFGREADIKPSLEALMRGQTFYAQIDEFLTFLLGLIARLDRQYRIRSNGESGLGRYDICLIPRDTSKKGIVMEIKAPRLGRKETLEQCMAAAREQIEAGKYDTELAAAGVAEVLRLAIGVDGKEEM